LGLVDHVVTGNGVNRDGGFRQISIHTVATVSFSTGWVASRIFRLNLGVNIAVLGQFGTRNVHVPSLAVSINGSRVVLAVHGHGDGVASLDVFTHGTGNGHVRFRLGLVDHVIFSDHINSDLSFRQIGIDTVAAVSLSTGGVTRRVFSLNLGVNIAVLGQLGARNVHDRRIAVKGLRVRLVHDLDSDSARVTRVH